MQFGEVSTAEPFTSHVCKSYELATKRPWTGCCQAAEGRCRLDIVMSGLGQFLQRGVAISLFGLNPKVLHNHIEVWVADTLSLAQHKGGSQLEKGTPSAEKRHCLRGIASACKQAECSEESCLSERVQVKWMPDKRLVTENNNLSRKLLDLVLKYYRCLCLCRWL